MKEPKKVWLKRNWRCGCGATIEAGCAAYQWAGFQTCGTCMRTHAGGRIA